MFPNYPPQNTGEKAGKQILDIKYELPISTSPLVNIINRCYQFVTKVQKLWQHWYFKNIKGRSLIIELDIKLFQFQNIPFEYNPDTWFWLNRKCFERYVGVLVSTAEAMVVSRLAWIYGPASLVLSTLYRDTPFLHPFPLLITTIPFSVSTSLLT